MKLEKFDYCSTGGNCSICCHSDYCESTEFAQLLNAAHEFYQKQVEERGMDKLTVDHIKTLHESEIKKYKEALIWCSGSDDFQIEGKARKGWEKICLPLLKEEALKTLEGEDGKA